MSACKIETTVVRGSPYRGKICPVCGGPVLVSDRIVVDETGVKEMGAEEPLITHKDCDDRIINQQINRRH